MDALLNQIAARFEAQRVAGYIREWHDDEPTGLRQFPAAFVASQGPQVIQHTAGAPGKVIISWRFDLYYGVPVADRRGGFRELGRISPLVMIDWLTHGRATRLGGLARNVAIGQDGNRGQFVEVTIGQTDVRALLLPLVIETETLI